MKRLIIAAALFATLGANASTHILHTIYQCGNHVEDKHAMKTDGEAHWHTTDKATTNGIVVYNGSSLDIPYHGTPDNDTGFYNFDGFVFATTVSDNSSAYSNDGGAHFYKCTQHTTEKTIQ